MMRLRTTQVLITTVLALATGCASVGSRVPVAAVAPPAANAVAVPAPAPAKMTLPQFLGLDMLVRGVATGVRQTRLRLAKHVPALQPTASAPPRAIGDPQNLQSPSPSVAIAADIQLAEAEAPAKTAALAYLATLSCAKYPEIEEAILAGLDDISTSVRAAAAQAIISSQANGCCTGCCTESVRSKLLILAYEKDELGCFCEPDARVRRLCRLALCDCGQSPTLATTTIPMELPPAALIEEVHALPVNPDSRTF